MLRKREYEKHEVPVAPMLDLAFNLLTFFIITYRPSPTEVQFNLNLLPSAPVAQPDAAPAEAQPSASDAPAPISSLTTTLYADAGGDIGRITLEEIELTTVDELRTRLGDILGQDLGFEQALIQVDPNLKYEHLIEVISAYQALKLTKISFSTLP